MSRCHMGHIDGTCAGEEMYRWPCPEKEAAVNIDPHDIIANKMAGYRAALGLSIIVPLVTGSGPVPPRAVLLGGNPDGASASAQMPFLGIAGQLLDGFLAGAGLNREQMYLTYGVKFMPGQGGEGNAAEYRSGSWPFLKKELKVIGKTPHSDDQGMVIAYGAPCRLMVVMGRTPALMLWGKPALKLTGGTICTALIGKQRWTALVTHDPGEAVASGEVKAEMREHFMTLAAMITKDVSQAGPDAEA